MKAPAHSDAHSTTLVDFPCRRTAMSFGSAAMQAVQHAVYVIETKAQSALSDENVQRKQRAALSWMDQINTLDPDQRGERDWHYVLLGEQTIKDWKSKNAKASDLLDFARLLRHKGSPTQEKLI